MKNYQLSIINFDALPRPPRLSPKDRDDGGQVEMTRHAFFY